MKNGFFPTLSFYVLFLMALLGFHGCATFLELGGNSDNPEDYDRGYATAETEEEEEDDTATSRRPSDALADEDSAQSGAQRRISRAIETRDVVLGMNRNEVMESWGQPAQREVAGRGRGGHERWIYGSRYSLNGPRTVIFENGRVAGWNR